MVLGHILIRILIKRRTDESIYIYTYIYIIYNLSFNILLYADETSRKEILQCRADSLLLFVAFDLSLLCLCFCACCFPVQDLAHQPLQLRHALIQIKLGEAREFVIHRGRIRESSHLSQQVSLGVKVFIIIHILDTAKIHQDGDCVVRGMLEARHGPGADAGIFLEESRWHHKTCFARMIGEHTQHVFGLVLMVVLVFGGPRVEHTDDVYLSFFSKEGNERGVDVRAGVDQAHGIYNITG